MPGRAQFLSWFSSAYPAVKIKADTFLILGYDKFFRIKNGYKIKLTVRLQHDVVIVEDKYTACYQGPGLQVELHP